MTDEHLQLLVGFQSKVEHLKKLYEKEKAKNQALTSELEKEEKELMYAHKKLLELQTKYDNLATAGLLSVNDEERKKARNRLSKMVREIDKCLALLNQ